MFGPFQIDNQLFGTPRPILLYVTPTSKDEVTAEVKPALHICAHKMSSRHWNAQIFKVTHHGIKFEGTIDVEIPLWKCCKTLSEQ